MICSPLYKICIYYSNKDIPAKKNADEYFLVNTSALQSSDYSWKTIQKSSSPKIKCKLNGRPFHALIDSGAEVNALDKDFAHALGIGIVKTFELATAANRLPLDVYGQTCEPVQIECVTDMKTIPLNLGIVLVIANLGVDCLLGEPAKIKNNIICLPRQKIVVIAKGKDVEYVPYSQNSHGYLLSGQYPIPYCSRENNYVVHYLNTLILNRNV